jgi:hypothetical protein|tara:strand:- start:129 stop:818 length:690 start_codon:yes stop_codon:yes gene_type:complete
MNSHKTAARMFGIFFIFTFLSYGIGSGLIDSVITTQDFLANVNVNQTQVVIGVVLMALVHTFLNIGMPIIMLPILKPYNIHLAYGYLSAAVAATVTLVVGAICVLLLLPLSDVYVNASTVTIPNIEIMGMLLKKGSFFGYHMGMALWSLGGLMFVSLLYTSKLVPRPMSVWGMIGYVVLLLGSISEMFGHNDIIEIVSVIPGGLFEITLSVWLIIKGFNISAIGSEAGK